jgi:hypothetical protein
VDSRFHRALCHHWGFLDTGRLDAIAHAESRGPRSRNELAFTRRLLAPFRVVVCLRISRIRFGIAHLLADDRPPGHSILGLVSCGIENQE